MWMVAMNGDKRLRPLTAVDAFTRGAEGEFIQVVGGEHVRG